MAFRISRLDSNRSISGRMPGSPEMASEDVCRIELNGGSFMDDPPPGQYSDILAVYSKYKLLIRQKWDEIHQR